MFVGVMFYEPPGLQHGRPRLQMVVQQSQLVTMRDAPRSHRVLGAYIANVLGAPPKDSIAATYSDAKRQELKSSATTLPAVP